MNEAEGKALLEYFPKLKRSLIMNQFLAAIREGGAAIASDVLDWVRWDTLNRRRSRYASQESIDLQCELASRLESAEAYKLAEYCLWWESLSRDEKEKVREPNKQIYIKKHMATQPPTEKQLNYLASLGCEEVPKSKADASDLIEKYLNKRGEVNE